MLDYKHIEAMAMVVSVVVAVLMTCAEKEFKSATLEGIDHEHVVGRFGLGLLPFEGEAGVPVDDLDGRARVGHEARPPPTTRPGTRGRSRSRGPGRPRDPRPRSFG